MTKQTRFEASALADTFMQYARIGVLRRIGDVADQAVAYYRLGFNVIPLEYRGKRPAQRYDASGKALRPYYPLKLQYRHRFPTEGDVFGTFSLCPLNIGVILGESSGNLAEIDCDDMVSYNATLNAFLSAGISPWVYRSARGGKFLFYCADGELKNEDLRPDMEAEIRGAECLTVLPPSVHPSGFEYAWVLRSGERPPMLHIEQLRAVIPQVRLKRRRHLSSLTVEFLAQGVSQGERNNRLFLAAIDMAQHGITREEATPQLLAAARLCQPPMDDDEARLTINSAFKSRKPSSGPKGGGGPKPKKPSDDSPASGNAALVHEKARAYVASRTWTGRAGATDRAMMLALAERARIEGPVFRGSQRELAELARIERKTVQSSLRRLVAAALIERVHPQTANASQDQGAAYWRFTDTVTKTGARGQAALAPLNLRGQAAPVSRNAPAIAEDGVAGEQGKRCAMTPLGTTSPPVLYWSRYAPLGDLPDRSKRLSKTAILVFVALVALGRAKLAELRAMLRLTRDQVKRAIVRLEDAGIVRRVGYGEYEAIPERADRLLVEGEARAHRRKVRHNAERSLRVYARAFRAVDAARSDYLARAEADELASVGIVSDSKPWSVFAPAVAIARIKHEVEL